MDSRDSSSSTILKRDAPIAADDDMLSVTSALAQDAALLFQSRKFGDCIHVLTQLKQKKDDNLKVLHNVAITEYFRDGCSDSKKLLETLNCVKKRGECLAHAPGEQAETKNVGSKVPLVPKGSKTAANSGNTSFTEEFDTSVATLNIGVIWFHLREYAKVLSVLEPLYQSIEPIDETTALQICLVLMDAVLACRDAAKSVDVLNYLGKAFGGGFASQGENGTIAQSTSLVSNVPSSSLAADASSPDLPSSIDGSQNSLSRTLSDETLDYDNVLFEIRGQNLARPVGLSHSNDLIRTTVGTVDLKLKLQLYKVQFLLLIRNLKLAKREVKYAINIARGRDSSMALLLKSQLEYTCGNHRKAIKLLMASSNRTETGISSLLNNNLGCIYYKLGKYNTASVLFSKALCTSSSLRKVKPLNLLSFSQDKSLLITYNCGVLYLACGKPVLAFQCFQMAGLVFYRNPLLWLRLGECCLMALRKGLLKGSQSQSDRSEVRIHVVGKGKWRELVMEDWTCKTSYESSAEKADWVLGTKGRQNLSLSLGRQCLLNALHLLNAHHGLSISKVGNVKEQKGGTVEEAIQDSISCYASKRRKEFILIKQVLLANLAYVELELENPLKALVIAKSLLELSYCSRIYLFLGNVYAAEACCLLNKPKEAADHLSVYLSGGYSFELPFHKEDCEKWHTDGAVDCEELNGVSMTDNNSSHEKRGEFMFPDPEQGRGTLYSNLAFVYAIQGDLERANYFVMQALSVVPTSPEATLTAVYVDLLLGNSQEALAKLKRCSSVRYFPSKLS